MNIFLNNLNLLNPNYSNNYIVKLLIAIVKIYFECRLYLVTFTE